MFKKLRNRFLLMMIGVTTLVFLIAAFAIYIIFYENIQSDIENSLQAMPEIHISPNDYSTSNGESASITWSAGAIASDRNLMYVEVDNKGEILQRQSNIFIDEKSYKQAVELAWNQPNNKKPITIDNRKWRYMISPVDIKVDIKFGEGSIEKMTSANQSIHSSLIIFLEVTDFYVTLFHLRMTMLFVGLLTISMIACTSFLFANRAVKPLEKAWKKQKQFVADASHELKTPISIINANYDVLMANQDQTIASQLKWLHYMQIGTERMTTLVNKLLTLAKLEDSNIELQTEKVNISNMIEQILATMQASIKEKELLCKTEIETDLMLNSDPENLQRVITILLENAVQHTQHAGEIVVSLESSKKHIKLSITNSGQGIPESELPNIFERFYQVNPSRKHTNGNYGLGLSIAKLLLDQLNGRITAQSIVGQYTTFAISWKL